MAQLTIELQERTGPGTKKEYSKTYGRMNDYPKEIVGPKPKKIQIDSPALAALPRRRGPRPHWGIRTGNCPYLNGLV